jgi:hypothetical protein
LMAPAETRTAIFRFEFATREERDRALAAPLLRVKTIDSYGIIRASS